MKIIKVDVNRAFKPSEQAIYYAFLEELQINGPAYVSCNLVNYYHDCTIIVIKDMCKIYIRVQPTVSDENLNIVIDNDTSVNNITQLKHYLHGLFGRPF